MKEVIKKLLFVAITICTVAVANANDLVPMLLKQGLSLYTEKDYRGAVDYLGQVVDIAPEHDQARFYLVYSLALSGNSNVALIHAKKLLSRFPKEKKYIDIYDQLMKEIYKDKVTTKNVVSKSDIPRKKIFGGYQTFDVVKPRISTQTYETKPLRPKTKLELAIEKIDEGDNETATDMLKDIISKDPKNSEAYYNLGVIEFDNGNYTKAIELFKKAVKINPKSFHSFFLMGDSYRALEDYLEAKKVLKKALEIKQDVFAMLNLADVLIKLYNLEEAEKIFNRVKEIDPKMNDATVGLAYIKCHYGFYEVAAEMINDAISNGTTNPEAYFIKSQILLEGKLYREAAEQAKAALDVSPSIVKYQIAYANCLLKNYDISKAIEEARVILNKNPDSIEARIIIAEGLINGGALADAEEQMLIVEKKVKHPSISRLRAINANRNGDIEKANDYYQEYITRAVGQPRAAMEYAQFLEVTKDNQGALQMYRSIQERYGKTAYAIRAKEEIDRIEGSINEALPTQQSPAQQRSQSNLRPGKVKY